MNKIDMSVAPSLLGQVHSSEIVASTYPPLTVAPLPARHLLQTPLARARYQPCASTAGTTLTLFPTSPHRDGLTNLPDS